jgi:hypothetical protein
MGYSVERGRHIWTPPEASCNVIDDPSAFILGASKIKLKASQNRREINT